MSARILLALVCVAELSSLISAGGHGGGHKKVIIHVPLYVKHHHHKHTIVKHIHHKSGGGGGDDHYEVLGYTYGEPKAAPHGHGWGAADEGHDGGYGDSVVNFEDHGGYGGESDGHGY
ncbi:holotricin-3 [Plodia interpunctella]|uniref:holotricin-3 n=1 Tax=Plodia interpunctella TaxID=58824 RepID=UPI00236856AC|nr:holotricin-3 [Plodia interpunctella]